MLERIVITSSNNQTELLRTLAKYNQNTIGLHIFNENEFAQFVLSRSGIFVEEESISDFEGASIIYSFLCDIPYFLNASFVDAQNIVKTFYEIRSLIEKEEEDTFKKALDASIFKEKNDALYTCYKKYIAYLEKENRIDTIGYLRKIFEIKEKMDIEILLCKEFDISPLMQRVVEHIAKEVKDISIIDLFDRKEKKEKVEFVSCYGASNEVQDILTTIYENGYPLDTCLVVCANPKEYIQLFDDFSKQFDIPMTFGSGISITSAYPTKFAQLLENWNTNGYNGISALKKLIFSEVFLKDKLIEEIQYENLEEIIHRAGNLRLSFDSTINKERLENYKKIEENKEFYEALTRFSSELELGFIEFLKKYAYIRESQYALDHSALNRIVSQLEIYTSYLPNGNIEEVLELVLSSNVRKEISKEGYLHITNLSDAYASVRDHVFVCGLSADTFPGSVKENYLIFDKELLQLHKDALTSEAMIHKRKQALLDFVTFLNSLDIDIHLSYSNYNLATLKENNPSSILFDIYEEREKKDMDSFLKDMREVTYFDKPTSRSDMIAKAYKDHKEIESSLTLEELPYSNNLLDRYWSPSALELFFSCPRRFYLTRILNIPDEVEDDPFVVIDGASVGTMAHSLMEELKDKHLEKKEFLARASQAFDNFLLGRPPIHEATKEKKDFMDMMEYAYEDDPKRESISTEETYYAIHETGVKLFGIPDNIEKVDDDKAIIVDYKTKRKIDHIQDDIDTCLQVIIYGYLCEKNHIAIDHLEYRYFRKRRNITCKYDTGIKNALYKKMEEFKEALENNDFPRNENKDSCKYCTLRDICVFHSDIEEEVESDAE